ncbi:MAG: radical SAM protein [Pseudolabrys sp.]|nr:radical SAM protein [Pseudolabrys sp.]
MSETYAFARLTLPFVSRAKQMARTIARFSLARRLYARVTRKVWPIPPVAVSLEPTNHCNLKCSYCPKSLGIDRKKGFVSLEDFERFVERIGHAKLKRADLVGFGEIFVHKEWASILRVVRKRLPKCQIVITTNALLLTRQAFDIMNECGVYQLTVSLNGANRQTYKEINRVDKFDEVYAKLSDLVRYYKTLPNRNLDLVVQLIDTINSPGEIERFRREHADWFDHKILFYVHPYSNWGGYFFDDEAEERYPCGHLYVPGISWTGDVYACCVAYPDGNKDLLLGNLNDKTLEEIYRSDRFRQLHAWNKRGELHKHVDLCRNCNSWKRIPNVYFRNPMSIGPKWL